ncbi:acylneuraminate cytidylyltransferase family protein [Gammaproteobacteria bacterium]|jgi:CMP-N-acetylneuraminic acid synthetase|nr:acylneuraminate cytidylyltransferase family protein [Gammaproteobacteria bacterium]
MRAHKKVLGIIPARKGSKGIPKKNIKSFAGKELILWSIEAAIGSNSIDKTLVSTDCKEIAALSSNNGADVPFIRPMELSSDHSKAIDVVLHAIENTEIFDYVILLQPTSPLRTSKHIDEAFNQMLDRNLKSCVSISITKSNPYLMYNIGSNSTVSSVLSHQGQYSRRQDYPQCYELNGAIYIAQVDWLKKNKSFISKDTFGYIMSQNQSYDIDTMDDFLLAEKEKIKLNYQK